MWGHSQSEFYHSFSAGGVGGARMTPTLALQGHQKIWGGVGLAIDKSITGKDALGAKCTPEEYEILNGSSAAYSGSGLESIIPRHHM
jgi:hypothetical protein